MRAIRDEIGGLVDDLVLHRAKEIRADRTAHELRLLDSFDDARIRSHVATLAERRTRDCLRADHCYELEDAR